ncbi:hypothetical protein TSAR_013056 [Trichomalopsis sarcophagae]|uniref:Reverse transcriptase domain-containing protein n=1 Tax=Trichomalopsis sarcophagae TaxID=543379 RepID=A0A232EJ74_9HYME|nr:hypothetical protein TSAR_013056 [Trichomalopsis sarcophagae]
MDYEILQRLPVRYKLEAIISPLHPQTRRNKLSTHSTNILTCKFFETIVKNRLQWWVETQNIIPANQSGFRKGKSCADNLTSLTLKIDEAFSDKKSVPADFLDVNGAFDHVNIDILFKRLASIGCPHIQIFSDLNESPTFVHRGIPQGGVLSPLLYILYVANILSGLKKSVSISQFADNISLYVKCSVINRGKQILENAIKKVKDNLPEIGLELSPSKTKFIHFNNQKILPGSTEILINNISIISSESARFLSIIFNYNIFVNSRKKLKTQKNTKILHQCISNLTSSNVYKITTESNFNLYTNDYHTLITSIPINTSFASKFKKDLDPNKIINDYIIEHNALDFYTDGSKVLGNGAVGCSCYCPTLNLSHYFIQTRLYFYSRIYCDKRFTRFRFTTPKPKYYNLHRLSNEKPWFSSNNSLKRDFNVSIYRSRSGHYNIAESLARINIISDPKCLCNLYFENLNHVLWQCELYEKQRKDMISNLRKIRHYPSLCVKFLICLTINYGLFKEIY